ncbi:MAG TPA: hypothetical protein VGF68_12955, partial [Solirubrobacteraceae bacterium]
PHSQKAILLCSPFGFVMNPLRRPLAWTAILVERRCLLVVRGPRLATHQKAVIGTLANRFHNVANLGKALL